MASSQMGPLATHPNPKTPDEVKSFLADYMPIKFGSSLMSKLNKVDAQGKHYWEREDTAGKPFVLAIADFHKRADQDSLGSMTFTHSALWPYLYGHRVEWEMIDGELVVRPIKNQSHRVSEKRSSLPAFSTSPVPGTFPLYCFRMPARSPNSTAWVWSPASARPITGINASASATIPTRMRYAATPSPRMSATQATSKAGRTNCKSFTIRMPRSRLDHAWLGGLAQFYFAEDKQFSIIPNHHVWSSMTMLMRLVPKGPELQ